MFPADPESTLPPTDPVPADASLPVVPVLDQPSTSPDAPLPVAPTPGQPVVTESPSATSAPAPVASGSSAAMTGRTPGIWNPSGGAFNPGGYYPGGFANTPGSFGGRLGGFSGYSPMPPAVGGLADAVLDGFSLSASLTGTYDTNPSMGYGTEQKTSGGDFFMTLGGNAAYQSKASQWTMGANYNGSYSQYFTQSELSGYNQSAGGSINYDGGPFNAALNVGVGFGSGANRYYASVVDEISYNYGLSASYRVSPKTSLTANLSQSFTSASGGNASDTGSFSLAASALWRYSPLTEFGPGIHYTSQSGDTQQGRTSIGPTMTVNYKLSSKVSLNSMVGMDFSQYEDGQSADPTLSTSIALNYQASRLWGMNLSLNRGVQPDPARSGEYTESTSLRVGYNRKIRRASLNLGVSYETNSSQVPDGATAGGSPDRDYMSLDSSIGMPLFANTCSASIFVRYSDQSAAVASETWGSFQTGFSISRSF